jgi:hypothetical protein
MSLNASAKSDVAASQPALTKSGHSHLGVLFRVSKFSLSTRINVYSFLGNLMRAPTQRQVCCDRSRFQRAKHTPHDLVRHSSNQNMLPHSEPLATVCPSNHFFFFKSGKKVFPSRRRDFNIRGAGSAKVIRLCPISVGALRIEHKL